MLLSFDTTLSDLQLERKRLDVEKLKLQLEDAYDYLYEINSMKPMVIPEPSDEPTEPEEPAKQSNTGAILALVLILGAGGGAAYYFLVMKPKQAKNVPSDLDDFDLEDEEEYLTEE